MPYRVIEFEPTPNPNAVKCILDRPISDRPRSFLNAAAAASDAIAARLFADAAATCVLFNGTWMTVNRPAGAPWGPIKRSIRRVLSEAE